MNHIKKIKGLGFKNLEEYNNVYIDQARKIDYTDGYVEIKILEILKKQKLKGYNKFPLLEEYIIDWPTEYHFSWVRQNILKPISFSMDDVVLELGGGTGIISEYVIDKVNKLITIEGTEIRAKSIATRCSNFDNIDIIVANFLKLDLIEIFGENSFSKILLIGVLEYVPKFEGEKNTDAINKLLTVCRKLLKPDGELIIAIENKIGLKYLLGREEDHVSIKHYGTQSLYKKNDVVTFTKKQLTDRLNNIGFKHIDYYYPFPDYKLPKVIIREGLNLESPESKELIASLLSGIETRNYSDNFHEKLLEDRILSNFIEDEILGNISNSFLFVAKNDKIDEKKPPFLYYFSTSRKYQFSNEIIFSNTEEGILVSKKWNGKSTNNKLLQHISSDEIEYLLESGKLLSDVLNDYYLLDDKENYSIMFYRWLDLLIKQIEKFDNSFDLLPINTILDKNDNLMFFDYNEWKTKNKFTIPQIVKRYVLMNENHLIWLLGVQKNIDDFVILLLKNTKIKIENFDDLKEVEIIHNYIKDHILKKDYLNSNNKLLGVLEPNIKKRFAINVPPIIHSFNRQITKPLNLIKKTKKKYLKQKIKTIYEDRIGDFYFKQKGYCPCCEQEVDFIAHNSWLRDHFKCNNCYSIPRERALMYTINKEYPKWKSLAIHESSPGDRGHSVNLKKQCKNYMGSHFFKNKILGEYVNGIRNEDLENQTFDNETFDLVITSDVMEHIYEPVKAFKEIHRTLKPGGAHIFSVPLINKHNKTQRWATKDENGDPIFLNEPEWHGNPIDKKGSPVTMHWGFDIVDHIKKHTDANCKIVYIDDLNYGIRAEYIEIIVSKKEA